MVTRLKAVLRTYHRDERGAIAILVLLTIWCLVAIIGMVWNTMEVAYRRQRIQTAADAAAYSTQNWVSRTMNAITAQNMVISQDASTETIWAAVPDTDKVLTKHLANELVIAERMRGSDGLTLMTKRLEIALQNIASERDLMTTALNNLVAAPKGNYADDNEVQRYKEQYRRAQSVSDWVWNTYVQGAPPPSPTSTVDPPPPTRPGPPGSNGEGLVQLVAQCKPPINESRILDYIENFIDGRSVGRVSGYTYYPKQEMSIAEAFRSRTAPATAQKIDQLMTLHKEQVFTAELAMVEALADAVNQERESLKAAYQADITLATLKPGMQSSGSAIVTAPLMPAQNATPVTGHTDKIRARYPIEAAAAKLSPVIDIDPMNVHVNPTGNTDERANAIIWHPDLNATVPDTLRAKYPSLRPTYRVMANFPLSTPPGSATYPEGWGHIWAMPLEQYVHQRVNRDSAILDRDYMQALDRARTQTLAKVIRKMMGLPNNGNITIKDLPMTLPDDTPALEIPPVDRKPGDPPPPPVYVNIFVMPAISEPANASPTFRAQLALYNQHGAAYTGAVRSLQALITSYTAYFAQFTSPFASEAWSSAVQGHCMRILETLGSRKHFMVLSSYGLRPIPEWAKPGMYISVATKVAEHVTQINSSPVIAAIMQDLQTTDSRGVGTGILDANSKNWALHAAYIADATAAAHMIIRPTARVIAQHVAEEWVNRPWPYEIEPPAVPVPPFRGINPLDRKRDYTVLAGARSLESTAPKLMLSKIFGANNAPLTAYAQAETFNWMEFNSAYGGKERFDEIVSVSEVHYVNSQRYSFTNYVGSPRGWRVNSVGGWNWRTRLSLSDALYDGLQMNPELRQYLEDAGISNPSQGALDEVNLH
jgi:hypothetical protein